MTKNLARRKVSSYTHFLKFPSFAGLLIPQGFREGFSKVLEKVRPSSLCFSEREVGGEGIR